MPPGFIASPLHRVVRHPTTTARHCPEQSLARIPATRDRVPTLDHFTIRDESTLLNTTSAARLAPSAHSYPANRRVIYRIAPLP